MEMSNLDANLRSLKYVFITINDLGGFASFCVLLIMVKPLNADYIKRI